MSWKRLSPGIVYVPDIGSAPRSPRQAVGSVFAAGSLLDRHLWTVGETPEASQVNLLVTHRTFVRVHLDTSFLPQGCHLETAVGKPISTPSFYNVCFVFLRQTLMAVHSGTRHNLNQAHTLLPLSYQSFTNFFLRSHSGWTLCFLECCSLLFISISKFNYNFWSE